MFGSDCIGEELVKRNTHGAFAALLNSRSGWYDRVDALRYSGEFQSRFFEELLPGGHAELGMADRAAREAMLGQVETSGNMPYRWCMMGIVLFGDPQAAVRVPVRLEIEKPIAGPSETLCVVRWTSVTNRLYSVLRTGDLSDWNNASVVGGIAATPPMNTYTDLVVNADAAFYRIQADR